VIDPKLFTVERLLAAMLDDAHGNRDVWRQLAEIVPGYMPRFPGQKTRPICVVRVGELFLRHSVGPRQGFRWDIYGDDFQSPELALLALMQAPVPPPLLADEVWQRVASEREKAGGAS